MKMHLGIIQKLTLIFVLFAAVLLVSLGVPAYINGRSSLFSRHHNRSDFDSHREAGCLGDLG